VLTVSRTDELRHLKRFRDCVVWFVIARLQRVIAGVDTMTHLELYFIGHTQVMTACQQGYAAPGGHVSPKGYVKPRRPCQTIRAILPLSPGAMSAAVGHVSPGPHLA